MRRRNGHSIRRHPEEKWGELAERGGCEMTFTEKVQQPRMILRIFLILLLIATVVFGVFVWNETRIRTLDAEGIKTVTEEDGYQWKIDQVKIEQGRRMHFDISGWCIKTGEDQTAAAIHVVLKKESTGEYLVVPTNVSKREDVTKSLGGKYDYTFSGFEATYHETKKLNFSEEAFDIYLLAKFNDMEDNVLINTGEVLYAGS
jgi:hypothetical protein